MRKETKKNFATKVVTKENDGWVNVEWKYNNGLVAYSGTKVYFKDFKPLSTIECNELEAVLVLRTNDVVRDIECEYLKEWADNSFEGIEAIIVRGEGRDYHYIIPKSENYIISYGFATCEDCIKDYLNSIF